MQKKELLQKIGFRIRILREGQNLSLQMLADKIDIEYNNLIRIEKGRTNPTIWTLHKISQALGVLLKDIIDVETTSPSNQI